MIAAEPTFVAVGPTHLSRNILRVLRGLFILRLFLIVSVAAAWALRWTVLHTPAGLIEHIPSASPRWLLYLLPLGAVFALLFLPSIEKRIGRLYLPAVLTVSIVLFSLEYAASFVRPGMRIMVIMPTGHEINLFWASSETILFMLTPCVLTGAAFGLRGALKAAHLAALLHLLTGPIVWLADGSLEGFFAFLPLRITVIYTFPLITGYLFETWKRDHAALERAHHQLRGYAATVENLATVRERVRLSRALHDTLAHSLSAIIVQLEAIDALKESDPAAADAHLATVRAQARAGLEETRQAIQDLRAAPVEELGLAGALEQLVRQFGQRSGIQTHYHLEGEPLPLLPVQANALYRIAQEALENVSRHAAAARLNLSLSYENGVTMVIQDDGRGFDPAQIDPDRYGLVGIRERAGLVGAQAQVNSAPGQGTTLTVYLTEENLTG